LGRILMRSGEETISDVALVGMDIHNTTIRIVVAEGPADGDAYRMAIRTVPITSASMPAV